MKKKQGVLVPILTVVLIGLLAFTTAVGFGPTGTGSAKNIKTGLDLAGGVSITYQAKGDDPSQEDMDDTVYKLQKRVEDYSEEAQVYQEGDDRITVEIPGVTDANKILEDLGKPGSLEFQDESGNVVLDGSDIAGAEGGVTEDSQTGTKQYIVELTLTKDGTTKFADATAANLKKRISIVYDGETISSPVVQAVISDGKAQISGQQSIEEAKELASIIRIGSLKLELDVVNELIFEVSDSADEISIKMENGYQDYLSTKQKDSNLKVSYHSGHHHFEKGPTFTVVLPRQCENLTLDIVVGAGDISMESEAFTARKVNVSVGVGELSVNQISASEKAVFEVGTGDVSILNGQFPKVSIEAGVGDAVFSGSVSNKLEVEAGTGDVNVSLTGTEKSYAFDLSA